MASRVSKLRRPLIVATTSIAAVTLISLAWPSRQNSRSIETPATAQMRGHTDKIKLPHFPVLHSRENQLSALRSSGESNSETEYDLLVIGGGATGTGIALDAVTRGLKVALVERDDFSSGTSSKSTKLVHGGVRYLEKAVWNLDFGQLQLVTEALRERKTFLKIAPHLSISLPILLPLKHWWEVPYFLAGAKAYDLLAGSQGLQSSYFMPKGRAHDLFPLLRNDNLIGALVYYDGQHNDSRMNISLALTASLYGATVLNHIEVVGLEKDENGKICGARVRDMISTETGSSHPREFLVRAKGVVNATGAFTDAIEQMDEPSQKPIVAPARGTHIMLPPELCPSGMGLLDAATSDGRVVFVLPWQGRTLAGTTDSPCEVEQHPVPPSADIDFILKEVNKLLLPQSSLSRADVLAAWTGIRPLIRNTQAKSTESLVRNHLITVSPAGLLTCAGGKWTTYRQMAEDTVDKAIQVFGLNTRRRTLPDISGVGSPPFQASGTCCTRDIRLLGAHGYSSALPSHLMESFSIEADIATHLATNYGDRAWALMSDSPRSTARLTPSLPFIEAEIYYGVRNEAACTIVDIVSRRTRLSFLDVNKTLKALPRIIEIVAAELRWTEDRKEREWIQTVRFLESMGLEHREENFASHIRLRNKAQGRAHHRPELNASSSLQAGLV